MRAGPGRADSHGRTWGLVRAEEGSDIVDLRVEPDDRTRLRVSEEVEAALADRRGIVALESTVIAHGLPYPDNAAVARRIEEAVREEGAVPATIGIVSGEAVVGLDEAEIDRFSSSENILKAGIRDLGPALAAERSAATTVAATSLLAMRAGIDVFATGGIGGVHLGGESSLDLSGDLSALAEIPVTVVCAGAKAILDLPRTVEVLETLNVPVLGLRTDEFPAFYTRASGLALEHVMEDEIAVAAAVDAHRSLGLTSSVLVCNAPPPPAEMDAAEVARLVEGAIADAGSAGIAGKALTPWLLARLAETSGGATVRTNVALLESNARAAARIAVALVEAASPRVRGF